MRVEAWPLPGTDAIALPNMIRSSAKLPVGVSGAMALSKPAGLFTLRGWGREQRAVERRSSALDQQGQDQILGGGIGEQLGGREHDGLYLLKSAFGIASAGTLVLATPAPKLSNRARPNKSAAALWGTSALNKACETALRAGASSLINGPTLPRRIKGTSHLPARTQCVLARPDGRVERGEAGGDHGSGEAAHGKVATGVRVGLKRQHA
jgi:hypothetical protein